TMLSECVRNAPSTAARRGTVALLASSVFVLLLMVTPFRAQDAPLPAVSVGAGARPSFVHTDPEAGDATDAFLLDSLRLYFSGSVTKQIKFMVNTEYDGGNHIDVMDAAAMFEFSPKFNIWA